MRNGDGPLDAYHDPDATAPTVTIDYPLDLVSFPDLTPMHVRRCAPLHGGSTKTDGLNKRFSQADGAFFRAEKESARLADLQMGAAERVPYVRCCQLADRRIHGPTGDFIHARSAVDPRANGYRLSVRSSVLQKLRSHRISQCRYRGLASSGLVRCLISKSSPHWIAIPLPAVRCECIPRSNI
jgi:hypothetical protein